MDHPSAAEPVEAGGTYLIRVQGLLHRRWSARFDGMRLSHDADGTTVLRGELADQDALHRILRRTSDLGLHLIAVTRSEAAAPQPPDHPTGGTEGGQ